MKDDISVPAGKVVGIGKLKIFISDDFPYEIPTFSFLVAKTDDGKFVATCIQLLIDGDGETSASAIDRLCSHIVGHLKMLFDGENVIDAWTQLHDSFNDDFANSYWKAYRDIQLNLAEQGISTDSKSVLYGVIAKLKKQIVDLKEAIDRKESGIEVKLVDYQEPAA